MARRKRGGFEELVEALSGLPWWVNVGFAVVSYSVLGLMDSVHVSSTNLGLTLVISLLVPLARYAIPAACLLAVLHSIGKDASGSTPSKAQPARNRRTRSKSVSSPSDYPVLDLSPKGEDEARLVTGVVLVAANLLRLVVHRLVGSSPGPLDGLWDLSLLVGVVLTLYYGVALFKGALGERPFTGSSDASSSGSAQPPSHFGSGASGGDSYPWVATPSYAPASRADLEAKRPSSFRSDSLETLLDDIEWRRFEALVERLFQIEGYTTQTKAYGPDDGVDITLLREHDGQPQVTFVQCKHWHNKQVGVDVLRALVGSMAKKADRGIVVTSSSLSGDASAYAAEHDITVMDRADLVARLLALDQSDFDDLVSVATEGNYMVPTCASCGIKLVLRDTGDSLFWGCRRYPRCKSMIHLTRQRLARLKQLGAVS